MATPQNDGIREKILYSAAALLEEKTFGEISLSAIASKAGVTKGSVYYYYKTKDEILYDIADSYLCRMYEDLESWVCDDSKDTSLPRLIKYLIERGVSGSGRSLRLNLTTDATNGDEIIRQKLLARYKLFSKQIGSLIYERIPESNIKYSKEENEKFFGMLMIVLIDGLMVQSLLKNPEIDENLFAKQLIEMFITEKD